ncbi:MAG: hypothetical protein U5N55_04025 [Cypionkella sp.]|nr:hypothetical protein [Cypionkella sp.]
MKSTLGDLSNLISMKDVPGNARAISPRIVQASTLLENARLARIAVGIASSSSEKVAKVEATADDILALMRDHQNGIADAAGFLIQIGWIEIVGSRFSRSDAFRGQRCNSS